MPSLRDRRRQETADLILDAAVALLGEAGLDGFSVDAVADRVGVSARTVYRYFPDRAALLHGVMQRDDLTTPYVPPTTPEEISHAFGDLFALFDERADLNRAELVARVARTFVWEGRIERIRHIETALHPALDQLPKPEREQATAVIVYLANVLAWLSMRDESGLDGANAGAAVIWAIDTLVADLRQRNHHLQRKKPSHPR
jgi:AcrR family transcriptional regulator